MQLEKEIVQTVKNDWPTVRAIYLFGSFASGNERPDSDIDIAVLGPGGSRMPPTLSESLQATLIRDLDLIDLRVVPTILQKEVISSGKLLWAADQFELDNFELFVWSAYQHHRESLLRAGFLEAELEKEWLMCAGQDY